VNETEYIKDDGRRLANRNLVRDSMRYFYEKTGVQPYLWITEDLGGSKDAPWDEIEAAMEELYTGEFTGEGHLLLLFYEPEPGAYKTAYLAGAAAKAVIDDEAARMRSIYDKSQFNH
jgi:hypothetical protein